MNLQTLSYSDAESQLAGKSDEELIVVLAGSSRKLGDTAHSILWRRNRVDLVIDALRKKKIPARDGKVRALNLLLSYGRRLADALPIYRQYADDRSADVVSTALHGLVLWQDQDVIPYLESLLAGRNSEMIQKALAALRAKDPKKYSPYFHDSQGVWKEGANQALVPTPMSVTPAAGAPVAPATGAAHL